MKRIILSEGENDTIFLKELLTKKMTNFGENEILFFDQNPENIKKDLKFLEERYFERLDTPWMPYKLLVKSEGGKSKVIGVTISKLVHLCQKGYDPIMLIDLDSSLMNSNSIKSFIDRFEEKLINRFRGISLTIESNELHKISDALMYSMTLFKNTKPIGTIYIIGFYQTLEIVTGIKKNHTDEEKKKLSQTYIKKSKIHEIFNKALNNF